MASKLTQLKREEMFAAFRENPAEERVAQKCKVHKLTVRKYRKLDNWDKRLKEIESKVQEFADYDAVKERRKDLQILQIVQTKILQQIQRGEIEGKYKDLLNAIELKHKLTGEPLSNNGEGQGAEFVRNRVLQKFLAKEREHESQRKEDESGKRTPENANTTHSSNDTIKKA